MQFIFFVPPNEELEGTLHPQKCGCTPKNEGKRVHVPPDEKTCGHAVGEGRFFIWGYMYPFTFIFGGTSTFLGVQCTPLSLHLGVQRNLTAFSPRKVVHHAVFCKYYALCL
jgi:hypothetical protein